MPRIPLVAALVTGLGAGACALVSVATASTPAAAKGTEHITIITTSLRSPAATLIARGVFTAGGSFVFSNTGGVVKLPNGSFKVTTARDGKTHIDSVTCLISHIYSTKYTISGGTGAYKHITGSGTADVTERAILPQTASRKCNQKANPTVFQSEIEANGPVSIP